MKDLFEYQLNKNLESKRPLAGRMRPRTLDEFIGQEHLLGEGKFLRNRIENDKIHSMIFYGPAGVGKTTLAKIIAKTTKRNFFEISAVTSNVKELREVIEKCRDYLTVSSATSILFIDEVHRFNKTQQDVLLPHVEDGLITLIGATTENPYFEINRALLSRVLVVNLLPLQKDDLNKILDRALSDRERGLGSEELKISDEARQILLNSCRGDARELLNSLETASLNALFDERFDILPDDLHFLDRFDKSYSETEKFNNISAFIKSIRGSDPDAAIHYLAKMLNAGEDIKYIARRLIISASEDISNADPMAMVIASSCFNSINVVGMPEARIILAQTTTYLACAPKSNRSYEAIDSALSDLKKFSPKVPHHLRDSHDPQKDKNSRYKNPHKIENLKQSYMPEELSDKIYYNPKDVGYEKTIKKRREKNAN